MTANNSTPKSALPHFACHVCGNSLQQDSLLEPIDDEIMKSSGACSTTMYDEWHNEL
ncbi:unnamed protein product, partial [Adineta steineri]